MKKQIIIALATLTALPAVSQEKWDLRKCIDYAIEHNLSIKQQEAARDQNAVDLNTAKYSRLPNLNATPVLSYWEQPLSSFFRPRWIGTELSHDVLNPARVPL